MSTKHRSTPLERLAADPKSLRKAINAYCYGCVGGEGGGQNPYRLVRECPSTACELYAVRPWQQKGADESEETPEEES